MIQLRCGNCNQDYQREEQPSELCDGCRREELNQSPRKLEDGSFLCICPVCDKYFGSEHRLASTEPCSSCRTKTKTVLVPAGNKEDSTKPRPSLLPWEAIEEVLKVLEFGAQKYAPDNWRYIPDAKRHYWDAAMRHLITHKNGEQIDAESERSHLAHAACCVLFMLALELKEGKDDE